MRSRSHNHHVYGDGSCTLYHVMRMNKVGKVKFRFYTIAYQMLTPTKDYYNDLGSLVSLRGPVYYTCQNATTLFLCSSWPAVWLYAEAWRVTSPMSSSSAIVTVGLEAPVQSVCQRGSVQVTLDGTENIMVSIKRCATCSYCKSL